MARSRARISNGELHHIENVTAYTLSILHWCETLMHFIDDPDQMHILSLIANEAEELRQTNIDYMQERKRTVKQKRSPNHVPPTNNQ